MHMKNIKKHFKYETRLGPFSTEHISELNFFTKFLNVRTG